MDLALSTPARRPRLRDRPALLRALREAAVLTRLEPAAGFGPDTELHVVLVGGRTMARLNAAFLGRTGLTDVLAFALGGSGPAGEARVGGEIYVCLTVAVEAAARYRTSVAHECLLYAVHGMLHLAGYDDGDARGRGAMRRAEGRVLRRLRATVDLGALFGEGDSCPPVG
jgi:probable rRNA maturation factor